VAEAKSQFNQAKQKLQKANQQMMVA